MTLYPDYPWQPLEFVRDIKGNRPRGYWANERNILKALEGAETKLGITQVLLFIVNPFFSILTCSLHLSKG